MSLPQSATQQSFASNARSRSPLPRPRHSLSRQSSYHEHSRGNSRSPALRPAVFGPGSRSESNEWLSGSLGSRDESAFYQAETSMLTRENQMLKIRIRELGKILTRKNVCGRVTHANAIHRASARGAISCIAEPACASDSLQSGHISSNRGTRDTGTRLSTTAPCCIGSDWRCNMTRPEIFRS